MSPIFYTWVEIVDTNLVRKLWCHWVGEKWYYCLLNSFPQSAILNVNV